METNQFLLAIVGLVIMSAIARWMFVALRGKAPDHMLLALFAEAQRELITNSAQAEYHKAQAAMYMKRIDRLRPEIREIESKRASSKARYRGEHAQPPAPPRPPSTDARIAEMPQPGEH